MCTIFLFASCVFQFAIIHIPISDFVDCFFLSRSFLCKSWSFYFYFSRSFFKSYGPICLFAFCIYLVFRISFLFTFYCFAFVFSFYYFVSGRFLVIFCCWAWLSCFCCFLYFVFISLFCKSNLICHKYPPTLAPTWVYGGYDLIYLFILCFYYQ